MEAKKYHRMVTMMEELALMHEELDIDNIEQKVLEMMETGVKENDDVRAWEVDTEGDQIMHQVGQVLVVVVEEMY